MDIARRFVGSSVVSVCVCESLLHRNFIAPLQGFDCIFFSSVPGRCPGLAYCRPSGGVGLKGRNNSAQGNTLGIDRNKFPSPSRGETEFSELAFVQSNLVTVG